MPSKWPGVLTLYLQGLVQGIGFTTIPAAANFLIAPSGLGLSTQQYGSLFLPMIVTAIIASFFGGVFAERHGTKRLLLWAAILNIAAMGLFANTVFFQQDSSLVYINMLLVMALLGGGFGANITALNPFVVYFFPNKASVAVTALHTCLGIGTALGPLLWNHFAQSTWWTTPALIGITYFILFALAWVFLPLRTPITSSATTHETPPLPRSSLWPLALIAFLYGITETTFGNWTTIFLHEGKQFSMELSNLALSVFWGAVTLGRLATALLAFVVAPKTIYRLLPFIILISLVLVDFIGGSETALLTLAIAGLGCSAFLPLTISITEKKFYSDAAFASGLLIATYMTGYGVAAQGVGLLHKAFDISWQQVYLLLCIPVLLLAPVCYAVTRNDIR